MPIERFRVRAGHRTFNDRGPDLLRPKDNARRALLGMLEPGLKVEFATRFEKRDGSFTDWDPVRNAQTDRRMVLSRFDTWAKGAGRDDIFQVGAKQNGGYDPIAVVRFESVPLLAEGDLHRGAKELHALVQYQFPPAIFAGGFVCKQSAPGVWSDHAFHDAVDETQNTGAGVTNDEVTDWLARMGRARCVDYDYALGSRDGKVVIVSAPDYELELSGASSSHLWHVHISDIDHNGARPPCA